VNTLILSLDSYPANDELNKIVEKLNMAFTLLFVAELLIKIIALGFRGFFRGSYFNIFDGIVVLGGIVDIAIANLLVKESLNDSSSSSVTVLRGFRLLRLFRLAKQWRRLELLLETLAHSLKDIANFAIFMFLFIFIFTLLAMELFAFKAKFVEGTDIIDQENGVSPDFNFDTFLNSFSLVFIILTNDGESAVYYNYYRTVGPAVSTLYFVVLVMVGQKIIINLFIAILLENFDEGALRQKLHDFE
jgi:hypothetical protein